MKWLLLLKMTWTLLLLTWSTYLLWIGLYLSAIPATVLAVVEMSSSTMDQGKDILDPASVILVELWNLAMYTGRRCTVALFRRSQATINAYIIGMNASANSYLWSRLSQTTKCCSLLRSYATAHTRLSTKTLSERYSDL